MNEQVKTNSLETRIETTINGMEAKFDTMPLAQPFRITIPFRDSELAPLMDDYYSTMMASGKLKTNFKGFRPGKVPKDMVIQHNGGPRFYEPLFSQLLRQWADKHDKEICSHYDLLLDDTPKDGFKLGATIYFMPYVRLPKSLTFLKSQEIKNVDADLVAQRVEAHIEHERFKSATFEPDSAPISTGHQVAVKLETVCGRKKVKDRTGVFTAVIKDKEAAEWWQPFVIGLVEGDTVDKTFVDTEPHSRFFDQELVTTLVVQSVQKVILPPVDTKFLADHGVRSKNGWREQLFTRFYKVMKQTVDNDMAISAIDAILMKAKIDPIPSIWVESIVRQTVENMKVRVGKTNLLRLYNATTELQLVRNMQAQTFIELRDEMVLRSFGVRKKLDTKVDGWVVAAKSELADYIRALNDKETPQSDEK